MFNAHTITKSDQKLLLAFHKIDLKKVLADGVARAELERFVKPSDLFGHRLLLHKDGTEFPVGGQGGNGRFVKLAVTFPDPEKHVADQGRVDFLIDFEGVHSLFCLGGVNTPQARRQDQRLGSLIQREVL